MDKKTENFLKRSYKEFYFTNIDGVETPKRIGEREFGYIPFAGSMIRHLAFKTEGELRAFLVKEAPKSVYYSISYYFEPTLPMHEKGWKGADLAFDIDCDSLNLPCKDRHDRWRCRECSLSGTGRRPDSCPHCGHQRIVELNWACDICMDAAKREAVKLVDILIQDFGIAKGEIKVYYSGSMGYHVTVEGSLLEELDQMSRIEVADYVSGRALMPEILGVYRQAAPEELQKRLPATTDPGWRGRIAEGLSEYRVEGFEDQPNSDVKEKVAKLYAEKGYKEFSRLLGEAVKKTAAAIDTSVTTDIHRIFRLPGTLHGETGLKKTKVRDLLDFDPFTEAVAFGEEPAEVFVDLSPEFRLKNHRFGPYSSEKVKLPLMAAVYLMGFGLARLV